MKVGDIVYTYSLIEDEIYKGRVSRIYNNYNLFCLDDSEMKFTEHFSSYEDVKEFREKEVGKRTLKMKLTKLLRKIRNYNYFSLMELHYQPNTVMLKS